MSNLKSEQLILVVNEYNRFASCAKFTKGKAMVNYSGEAITWPSTAQWLGKPDYCAPLFYKLRDLIAADDGAAILKGLSL